MRVLVAALLPALLAVIGCAQKPMASPPAGQLSNHVTSGDLSARLVVDKPVAVVDNSFQVWLSVTNMGKTPVPVLADSTAPMIVTLWRYTPTGWERFREFPQSAVRRSVSWQLHPGQTRDFHMTVPVTPDWPMTDLLKLTAEMNGRPEAQPAVLVRAIPKAE